MAIVRGIGSVANAVQADLVRCIVTRKRPALFRGRHFEDVIILLCVRWYLRYSLTYRDVEEIMAERNLSVDYVTIWRWVQLYAPVLSQRIRREMQPPNGLADRRDLRYGGEPSVSMRSYDRMSRTQAGVPIILRLLSVDRWMVSL